MSDENKNIASSMTQRMLEAAIHEDLNSDAVIKDILDAFGGPGAIGIGLKEVFASARPGGPEQTRIMIELVQMVREHRAEVAAKKKNLEDLATEEVERVLCDLIEREGYVRTNKKCPTPGCILQAGHSGDHK